MKFLQSQIERVETNIRKEFQSEIKRLSNRQNAVSDQVEDINGKIDELLRIAKSNSNNSYWIN